MICVKSIEVFEFDGREVKVAEFPPFDLYTPDSGKMMEIVGITEEMVTGTRFRNSDGIDVCIGMTKKVQVALGIPFSAFETQESMIYNANETARLRWCRVLEYRDMGTWDKLMFLFGRYNEKEHKSIY